ncbi:hypothetical protein KY289_026483 [Solanum tuberosum]|nr:hypothetical protein KY289_026483 [Solanum tuberosum]
MQKLCVQNMGGGALLNLIVREIQLNKVILNHELEHNQVNKVLFVVTTLLCQEPLKHDQLPPLSGHKRPYNSASFAAATGGNRRLTTSFGVYSDPTTRVQIFNPGTPSEKILHGATKLKSASPTNINIGFKPRGLKWKEKDAVSISQSQQMKANKKNKGFCRTSKK